MSSGFSAQSLFTSSTAGVGPSAYHSPVTGAGHFSPHHGGAPSPLNLQERHKLKIKRTRQRVDAGEPRNTYSSIPNYSSTRAAQQAAAAGLGPSQFHRLLMENGHKFGTPAGGLDLSSAGLGSPMYTAEGLYLPPPFLGLPNGSPMHLFGGLRGVGGPPTSENGANSTGTASGGSSDAAKMDTSSSDAATDDFMDQQDQPMDLKKEPGVIVANQSITNGLDEGSLQDQKSTPSSNKKVPVPASPPMTNGEGSDCEDRAESVRSSDGAASTVGVATGGGAGGSLSRSNSADASSSASGGGSGGGKSKRKQYQPQQVEPMALLHAAEHHHHSFCMGDGVKLAADMNSSLMNTDMDGLAQFDSHDDTDTQSNATTPPLQQNHDLDDKGSLVNGGHEEGREPHSPDSIAHRHGGLSLPSMVENTAPGALGASAMPPTPGAIDNAFMLKQMQAQLVYMQQRYVQLLSENQKKPVVVAPPTPAEDVSKPKSDTVIGTKRRVPLDDIEDDSTEVKALSEALKKKLVQLVNGSVDRILVEYIETAQKTMAAEDLSLSGQNAAARNGIDAILEKRIKSPSQNGATHHGKDRTSSPQSDSVPGLKPLTNGASCPPGLKDLSEWAPRPTPPFYLNPSLYYNAAALNYANASNGFFPVASMAQSIFPTFGAPGRNAFFPGLPPPPPPTSGGGHTVPHSHASGGMVVGGGHHGGGPTLNGHLGLPPGLVTSSGMSGGGKDEAISLVLPKKKRSKVTDTRVTKLHPKPDPEGLAAAAAVATAAAAAQQQGGATGGPPGFFHHSPTMVPHHQLMLSAAAGRMFNAAAAAGHDGHHTHSRDEDSPSNSDAGFDCSGYESAYGLNTTLSPMHLRKAKLMFFYVRYPSSALLKAYFPDIMFNKNNTAQLVKWFSNFREFYYIQMEKYARQALAEGIRNPDEISVTTESEIYRVLNLHYNRNNHIAVPPTFPGVIQSTLQEFFKAIQASRDTEPSWKKAIYKVIARLDDPIPEYFKTPNFMEQLEG